MNMATSVQILDEVVCHSSDSFGKGMNLTIIAPAISSIFWQQIIIHISFFKDNTSLDYLLIFLYQGAIYKVAINFPP